MATQGSSLRPNGWSLRGGYAPQEQADWYSAMLKSALRLDWGCGFAFWAWSATPLPLRSPGYDPRGTQALAPRLHVPRDPRILTKTCPNTDIFIRHGA